MARTKQTARKTLVSSAPRFTGRGKGGMGAGRGKVGCRRVSGSALGHHSESEESISEIVNTQQFSLKFDDQDRC